jgi:hypothetical protein
LNVSIEDGDFLVEGLDDSSGLYEVSLEVIGDIEKITSWATLFGH